MSHSLPSKGLDCFAQSEWGPEIDDFYNINISKFRQFPIRCIIQVQVLFLPYLSSSRASISPSDSPPFHLDIRLNMEMFQRRYNLLSCKMKLFNSALLRRREQMIPQPYLYMYFLRSYFVVVNLRILTVQKTTFSFLAQNSLDLKLRKQRREKAMSPYKT